MLDMLNFDVFPHRCLKLWEKSRDFIVFQKSLTRTSLFAGYKRACDAVNVPPLNSDDLASAMETLQSQSFITLLKDGKLMLQVGTFI